MAKIIGLTGGIASGKSAVSNYVEALGYKVIDADLVAREVVEKGSHGLELLCEHFGEAILDTSGELDRKRFGELIFNNEANRLLANRLLHPLIEDSIRRRLEACALDEVVFLVVPLFYEAGYQKYTDDVWYVTADEASRLLRMAKRDAISEDLAKKKLESQLTKEEVLKKFSPTVIENNSTLEVLKEKVDDLVKKL